jgi:hypothetical protein
MSSPGNPRYQVHCSSELLRSIKRLKAKADRLGIGVEVLSALRTINRQLEQTPLEFGEPTYRLKSLKLKVLIGIVEPLLVRYAVHQDLPIVFVMQIEGLSRYHL